MTFYALAPQLANERQRQQAVDGLGVASFKSSAVNDLARRAAQLFETCIGLATIIDRNRLIVSGAFGTDLNGASRDSSFCSHAIARPQLPTCILDTSKDVRFAGNPMVSGDPQVRFYIGAPLVSPCGHALGALCAIDTVARSTVSDEQISELRTLARLVVAEMMRPDNLCLAESAC